MNLLKKLAKTIEQSDFRFVLGSRVAVTIVIIGAVVFSVTHLRGARPSVTILKTRPVVEEATLYKCDDDRPIPDEFTQILSVGRLFQMVFYVVGQLKPCTIVSASTPEREMSEEPAATIGGAEFVERVQGDSHKCEYVMRNHDSNDFNAMIVFDRLSAEYHIGLDPILGDTPLLVVSGKGRAVCTQFHDQKIFRGMYPASGDGVCTPDLRVMGQAQIDAALRTLRYLYANGCPHFEPKPY